jgi:hypothetical protein
MDNWLLENCHQAHCNFQLAIYATHLATGSTLWQKSIKSSTISKYLLDVAKLLGLFNKIDSPKTGSISAKLAPYIQAVLTEVARWEGVKDKQEICTSNMFYWQDHCCQKLHTSNQDSIHHTLCNWFGVPNGLRKQAILASRILTSTSKESQRPSA